MSDLTPIAYFKDFAPASGEATAVLERPDSQTDDQWVTEILLVNPWEGELEEDEEVCENLVSFPESY